MKNIRKAIALVLVFSMLLCMGITVSADESAGTPGPFRISCTVNVDPKTQRGFTWFTKDNTGSVLEIVSEDGTAVTDGITYGEVTEWDGNFVHKANVTGLEPGVTYTYTVGSESERSEEGTFRTDDGDSKTDFIVVADVQASSQENFAKGAATVNAALKTLPSPDFIVNLGDFTNDSTNEEWDLYDGEFRDINTSNTLVPISGNHDGFGHNYWFSNMFNLDESESVQTKDGINYSFDYGDCHIAVLNTNDMICMTIPQMNWLKNDMNSTDKDWKIVCMHKSPYTLGKDGKWPDAMYLQKSLTKVFDECDVDLVLSGHDHQYIRTKALKGNKLSEDGTVYVLAGTAGSKRYEIRSFLAGAFTKTEFINTLVVQKGGYGNYWNGEDWNSTDEKNIGGCFNTVSVDDGTLTFNSYILSDELTGEDGEKLITNTDSFTLTKETGKNQITFTGDNTTSKAAYTAGLIPSFAAFAAYTFGEWLPKFLYIAPKIIKVYIEEDTF